MNAAAAAVIIQTWPPDTLVSTRAWPVYTASQHKHFISGCPAGKPRGTTVPLSRLLRTYKDKSPHRHTLTQKHRAFLGKKGVCSENIMHPNKNAPV